MVFLVNMIRTWIGGKTELGILVSVLALVLYTLPIAPWLTLDVLMALLKVVAMLTGVALLSRVEDKKGFLRAMQSLFSAWRK